jgi:hypothetical protein
LNIKDEMSAGRNVAGDEGVGEGVNEGVGRNEARVFGTRASIIKTELEGEKRRAKKSHREGGGTD